MHYSISPYTATTTDGTPVVNATMATENDSNIALVAGLSGMSIVIVIIIFVVVLVVMLHCSRHRGVSVTLKGNG